MSVRNKRKMQSSAHYRSSAALPMKSKTSRKIIFGILFAVVGTILLLKESEFAFSKSSAFLRSAIGDRRLEAVGNRGGRSGSTSRQTISCDEESKKEGKCAESVYDATCPTHNPEYTNKGLDPVQSNLVSHQSGALEAIASTLQSGQLRDRRIVTIGDSVIHQIYISLTCLTHKADEWKDPDEFVPDRRVWLKDGAELLHAPWGGNLLTYGWEQQRIDQPVATDPYYDGSKWLDSCKKREPFTLITYRKASNYARAMHLSRIKSEEADKLLEKVQLKRKDHVFISASLHGSHRDHNMNNILDLVDCMKEAKENGEDPGWPSIQYVATPFQHFDNDGGAWMRPQDSDQKGATCQESIDPQDNQYYQEEKKEVKPKMKLIGASLGIEDLGKTHMGYRVTVQRDTEKKSKKESMGLHRKVKKMSLDCTHWSMPGTPDLFAKEIMKSISVEDN